VPSHCMRLPVVQTSSAAEEGRALCQQTTNTPSSPSTARSKGSIGMLQRTSVSGTLADAPQAEGLSFIDMMAAGAGKEGAERRTE